jgi:hypothetical protein
VSDCISRRLTCAYCSFSNVHVHTPFKVDSITHSTHKTYLDSTGHHAVTLKKSRCTEHHDGIVYVRDRLDTRRTVLTYLR